MQNLLNTVEYVYRELASEKKPVDPVAKFFNHIGHCIHFHFVAKFHAFQSTGIICIKIDVTKCILNWKVRCIHMHFININKHNSFKISRDIEYTSILDIS